MGKKYYAYVGNWSFEKNPAKGKGITTYEYRIEDGSLHEIRTICPEVAAGQLFLDQEHGILYSNDECGELRGEIGGGGYLLAFRIDPSDGNLTLMNMKKTLSPEPSYLCLDKSGKYLLTCHCSDPFHVTKIVKRGDGTYTNQVFFDDTTLTVFRVKEDGSLGDICDVLITEGAGGIGPGSECRVDPVSGHIQLVKVISRLHSVVASPSGELFIVCDKGMDKIYTFKLNRKTGKLSRKDEWCSKDTACFPRYGTFHPTLPVYYANNENLASVNTFRYEDESGKLEQLDSLYLLEKDPGLVEGKPVGGQAIIMHPSGKVLYCTLCGLNLIVVCDLQEDGRPKVLQRIDSRGILPRSLAFSPDGKYLFSGNMVSGDITTFTIQEDYSLSYRETTQAVSPSAMYFFEAYS